MKLKYIFCCALLFIKVTMMVRVMINLALQTWSPKTPSVQRVTSDDVGYFATELRRRIFCSQLHTALNKTGRILRFRDLLKLTVQFRGIGPMNAVRFRHSLFPRPICSRTLNSLSSTCSRQRAAYLSTREQSNPANLI